MTLSEFYHAIGGNLEEVLSRIPSEKLIVKYILKYPSVPDFKTLSDAFQAKDRESAFRASHTLKGLALNLGFKDLSQALCALTEILRNEQADWEAPKEPYDLVCLLNKRLLDSISLLEI